MALSGSTTQLPTSASARFSFANSWKWNLGPGGDSHPSSFLLLARCISNRPWGNDVGEGTFRGGFHPLENHHSSRTPSGFTLLFAVVHAPVCHGPSFSPKGVAYRASWSRGTSALTSSSSTTMHESVSGSTNTCCDGGFPTQAALLTCPSGYCRVSIWPQQVLSILGQHIGSTERERTSSLSGTCRMSLASIQPSGMTAVTAPPYKRRSGIVLGGSGLSAVGSGILLGGARRFTGDFADGGWVCLRMGQRKVVQISKDKGTSGVERKYFPAKASVARCTFAFQRVVPRHEETDLFSRCRAAPKRSGCTWWLPRSQPHPARMDTEKTWETSLPPFRPSYHGTKKKNGKRINH